MIRILTDGPGAKIYFGLIHWRKLMKGLSDDIHATLTFSNQKGTHIQIVFAYDLTEENNTCASFFKERKDLNET